MDVDGEEGTVDPDLSVRYTGRFADEMSAFAGTFASDDRGSSPSIPTLQSLAVALYMEFPLTEVEVVRGRNGRGRTALGLDTTVPDADPPGV